MNEAKSTEPDLHAADLCRPFLTRQGVRDLNGPRLDGRHNGRKSANCPHHRMLDYPTYREDEIRTVGDVEGGTTSRKVSVYRCSACGEERWVE